MYTSGIVALSFAETFAGYSNKNCKSLKNNKRAVDDGKREKGGITSCLSPSHRSSRAFLFSSPQPPYDTKRCGGEWYSRLLVRAELQTLVLHGLGALLLLLLPFL